MNNKQNKKKLDNKKDSKTMKDSKNQDKDFELLSFVVEKNSKNTSFSQREMAVALKISLGMTNNILKKTIKKGFLVASKLDGKKLSYILTPSGAKHLYSKSLNYIKNISKNAYQFKDFIFKETKKIKKAKYKEIVLIGNSSLDFIIEYCAIKNNLKYEQIEVSEKFFDNIDDFNKILARKGTIFYFISESFANFDRFNKEIIKTESVTDLNSLILENFVGEDYAK